MAAQLGYSNVDAMTRQMTSAQITEWEAYYRNEPFTADRIEYMVAYFMALYRNMNRPKGKKAVKPDKFLVFLNHSNTEQDQLDTFIDNLGEKEAVKDE